jgi:AcrR family transcriptional regulator
MPVQQSPVTRKRRKAARPQELLDAALSLFVDKGFAATRLEEVARAAGVSKGTVYLYYPSKEALFESVIREGILPALANGEALLAAHQGSAAELLRELLLGWWAQIGGTRLAGIPKLMICEARNFPDVARFYYEQVILRGRRLLVAAVARGIASGEFRAIDAEAAVDVIFAPPLLLAIWRFSMAPSCASVMASPEHYMEMHVDLLINGIKRGAATALPTGAG